MDGMYLYFFGQFALQRHTCHGLVASHYRRNWLRELFAC